MPGNAQAVELRTKSYHCVRYVSSMSGLIMVGFDWPSIEVIARHLGIEMDEMLTSKMLILEDLAIEYFNKKGGGENNGESN